MGHDDWWRDAVIYQVYLRSFSDGDGDGIGDIAGLRARLPYLAELGVDALWINPWYPSPMRDAGYDVSDFRDIAPVYGDLTQATELVAEAHALGLRVLLDLVPNHTSDAHVWFQAALSTPPGSRERGRYHFRDGRGIAGDEPPNDWISEFGGPSWSRTVDQDGRPGQWYLHLYAPEQPDLNWDNSDVVAEFDQTLRFWFDLGIDGFRIDVAHGLVKDPEYGDIGALSWPLPLAADDAVDHPHWDRSQVHAIYRSWRQIADSYTPKRVFAAEVWVGRSHRLVRYVRRDELHTAFNFDYLICPWSPSLLRRTIDDTIASHAAVGAPPTWVLSNHDVPREVSRYARPQPDHLVRMTLSSLLREKADFDLGLRRARAAALLMLALPGSVYIYQGGELGLPEVEDLPVDRLQDPIFTQTGGADRGRDGCRVPLPWSGNVPPYGFSPESARREPWLPQPADWKQLSAEAQTADPGSTLQLYRAALRLRHSEPAISDGLMEWLDTRPDAIHLSRGPQFACFVNFAAEPAPLPNHLEILLASGPIGDGHVPADTAVWLKTSE